MNRDIEPDNYWDSESFEDTVAAALIACYESKVRKNKGAAPADRLTDERVKVLRQIGPYIPSNSRVLLAAENGVGQFDLQNDPLPQVGLVALRHTESSLTRKLYPSAYLSAFYVRRAAALGKLWSTVRSGTLFEMLSMSAEAHGIDGERRFFTVSPDGCVTPCQQFVPNAPRGTPFGGRTEILSHPDKWIEETSAWASYTLQCLADARFCWSITAEEGGARAHLGCMAEEVKSLLYARDLPMTSTGRKRPILHLVAAHQRRLRNGTEIDVSEFLRGQQSVTIGSTRFSVRPPKVIKPQLPRSNAERFFPSDAGATQ